MIAWWALHRYWFMAGDDYVHVGQGGHPGGQFTAADWWAALANDWTMRNGRLADAIVRLVLRPGAWFYPLFAPIMLTVGGLAIAWATQQARRDNRAPWVWAAGLLLLPVLFWFHPEMAGDGVFWASGAINYALPLSMLIGCIGLLTHLLRGGSIPWVLMPLVVAWVMLTDAIQEMSSLALFFVTVAVLVTQWRRMTVQLWTLCGAALSAFVVHMSAPGLWKRAGIIADAAPGSTVERLALAITTSSTILWQRTSLLWLAIMVIFVAVALWPGRHTRGDRVAAWIAAAAGAAFGLASMAYRTRFVAGRIAENGMPVNMVPHTWLVVVTLSFAAIAIAVGLHRLRRYWGVVPLLAWAAYIGNCGFVFATGIVGTRAHFPPAVLLALVVLAMGAAIAERRMEWDRAAAALVVAGLLIPAVGWFDQTRVHLWRNWSVVDAQIVTPLEQATGSDDGEVVLPATLPYPELTYLRAFELPSHEKWLKSYYDIGDGVTLTNP